MNVVERGTPHKSSRGGHAPSLIVIHGDAGTTDVGTIEWIANPASRVSYHYLVGRNGTVYRFVDEGLKAWHAGVSQFRGEEIGNSVNPISVGVAFANDGTGNEEYRPPQYEAGAEIVSDICRRHDIPIHRIRGHMEVSPGRKTDPWDHFDWLLFFRLLEDFMDRSRSPSI